VEEDAAGKPGPRLRVLFTASSIKERRDGSTANQVLEEQTLPSDEDGNKSSQGVVKRQVTDIYIAEKVVEATSAIVRGAAQGLQDPQPLSAQ